MINKKKIMIYLLVLCSIIVGLNNYAPLQQSRSSLEGPQTELVKSMKTLSGYTVAVCSDIHYLSDSLRDDGPAFHTFNDSGDGKLLQYGSEIMESLVRDMKVNEVDVLIVSGDLTLNGEKNSHEALAAYFRRIEQNGTVVYVIPGNHDILNPYAIGFKDDLRYITQHISDKSFKKIYFEFGFDEAILEDAHSLSYVAEPVDGLWLLMLDTNIYQNNILNDSPTAEGVISEATLNWLNTVNKEKIKSEQSIEILSVMHHSLLGHSSMFSNGYTLNNAGELLNIIENLGVHLNLSGHIHIQDISWDESSNVYDIASSSLSVYPQSFGLLDFTEKNITYKTTWLDVEGYALSIQSENEDLIQFQTFSRNNFDQRSQSMVSESRLFGYTDQEAQLLTRTMGEMNVRFFAGVDSVDKEKIQLTEGFQLWKNSKEGFAKSYIMSMLEDTSIDNALSVPREVAD